MERTPDDLFEEWWKGARAAFAIMPSTEQRFKVIAKTSYLKGLLDGTRMSSERMGIPHTSP